MLRHSYFLALLLLLSPVIGFAREAPDVDSPAFTTVPELSAGFDLLYQQKFAEARKAFANWESRNPKEPFGEVAVAASYLFEELYQLETHRRVALKNRCNPHAANNGGERVESERSLTLVSVDV